MFYFHIKGHFDKSTSICDAAIESKEDEKKETEESKKEEKNSVNATPTKKVTSETNFNEEDLKGSFSKKKLKH